MLTALLYGFIIAVVVFAFVWAICVRIKNYSFLDVIWSYGVLILAPLYAFWGPGDSQRKLAFTIIGCAWSFRLGTYIFLRVLHHHPQEDVRYEGLRQRWPGPAMFLAFFELQALIVVLFSVPFLLAAWNPKSIGPLEIAGLTISCLLYTSDAADE